MTANEISSCRSAVNAPIIMPEEFRTLQPFVSLLEKMGSLYMQHFGPTNSTERLRTTFDLIYEGSLASANTTKPLFAALIKGTSRLFQHASHLTNIKRSPPTNHKQRRHKHQPRQRRARSQRTRTPRQRIPRPRERRPGRLLRLRNPSSTRGSSLSFRKPHSSR